MDKYIAFEKDKHIFSYRTAGILIQNGKVLLQKPADDDYAVPGAVVLLGETSKDALIRRFKEETGADIKIKRLFSVGEIFYPWGDKPCQQICFYYLISLCDNSQIPLDGTFKIYDEDKRRRTDFDFCWVPLSKLTEIKVYPDGITDEIITNHENIEHFISKE